MGLRDDAQTFATRRWGIHEVGQHRFVHPGAQAAAKGRSRIEHTKAEGGGPVSSGGASRDGELVAEPERSQSKPDGLSRLFSVTYANFTRTKPNGLCDLESVAYKSISASFSPENFERGAPSSKSTGNRSCKCSRGAQDQAHSTLREFSGLQFRVSNFQFPTKAGMWFIMSGFSKCATSPKSAGWIPAFAGMTAVGSESSDAVRGARKAREPRIREFRVP
jgi:hypothetical protein